MKKHLKTIKLAIINFITLLIGLGLLSGSVSLKSAQAARFESIPSVQIGSLENFRGQYLTVLYAVGSRSLLGKAQLTLTQIKDSRTVYITGEQMILPTVQVEKEGFRPSYNMIVVVVSPRANYAWVNADGSHPVGADTSPNTEARIVNIVNKSDVETITHEKGPQTVLKIDIKS